MGMKQDLKIITEKHNPRVIGEINNVYISPEAQSYFNGSLLNIGL
jgi:hypothetical protein